MLSGAKIFRRAFLLALIAALPAVVLAKSQVGNPAPDFVLKSFTGENLRLSEYRGQVVVLSFWASWCDNCSEQLKQTERLREQQPEVQFLGINIDANQDAAQALYAELGARYPSLDDGKKAVSDLYALQDIPVTVLIDRLGVVRFVHNGYRSGSEADISAELAELVSE